MADTGIEDGVNVVKGLALCKCLRQVRLRKNNTMLLSMQSIRELLVASPTAMRVIKRAYRSSMLQNSRFYQKWIDSKAHAVDKAVSKHLPYICLETTLSCNARCRMCMHHQQTMTGTMEMALFEKLVGDVVEMGCPEVCLSIYGEPFSDKHWISRVRKVREAGLQYRFFTNGSLMKDEILQEMLELGGWEHVNFSVNGFSSSVYESLMPPLKRDEVYQKIQRFLEIRERFGAGKPAVSISCIQQKANLHERRPFIKWWKSQPGVDHVVMGDCGTFIGELEREEDIRVSGYRREVGGNVWLAPCRSLWGALFVYHDGRVAPCCEDAALRKLIIGDANRDSLQDIFMGKHLQGLRKMHLQGRREQHGICGMCRKNGTWI